MNGLQIALAISFSVIGGLLGFLLSRVYYLKQLAESQDRINIRQSQINELTANSIIAINEIFKKNIDAPRPTRYNSTHGGNE